MIKKVIHTSLLLMLSVVTLAQEWHYDLTEAKKLANENNKVVILVFSGSDWCAPCMKLEKEIWENAEFQEYAKNHFVMVRADFPRKKQNKLSEEQQAKNNKLAEEFNKQGAFPLVVIMEASGNVLGKTGYKGLSAGKYIEHIKEFIK